MPKVPPRIAWAVELLDVGPDDRMTLRPDAGLMAVSGQLTSGV